MTREEAIKILQGAIKKPNTEDGYIGQALAMAIKTLEETIILKANEKQLEELKELIHDNPLCVAMAEPKTDKYEYHIDHTDCIWYGSDSGCPVTCSQYRDGWNDAMEYIYKDGKGYQPYRREE